MVPSPGEKPPENPQARRPVRIRRYFSRKANPRGHVKMLAKLNAQIGEPMHPDCKYSVVIPAYREGKSLERTLELFAAQKKIDPNEMEILVMMNRPNTSVRTSEAFGETRDAIARFKQNHPEIRLHGVEATFKFARNPGGGNDVRMGQVFKTAADLAVYRLAKREGPLDLDKHVIMTTGADYEYRPPTFLSRMAGELAKDERLVMVKPVIELSHEAYKGYPFLHVTHRMFTNLINRSSKRTNLSGEAVFTAGAYVDAGGFAPQRRIGEDIDLAQRMQNVGNVRRIHDVRVQTSARRRLAALSRGGTLIDTYTDFANPESVVPKKGVPPEELGRMDKERLESHMTTFYNYLLNRHYDGEAVDEKYYQISNLKERINILKRAIEHPEEYPDITAATIVAMAEDEAGREEDLRHSDKEYSGVDYRAEAKKRRAKYLGMKAFLPLDTNASLEDTRVSKQAKRLLELMRQRLGTQREKALAHSMVRTNRIFQKGVEAAGIRGFSVALPPTSFDKYAEIRRHKVTISDPHYQALLQRLGEYGSGERDDIAL